MVTGGGSNIGRGVVHGFAAEGAPVLICDIDGDQARKVEAEARERGAAEALAYEADLTTEEGSAGAVGHLVEQWGGIDVLVNNAGWSTPGFLTEQTDRAIWQRTMEITCSPRSAAPRPRSPRCRPRKPVRSASCRAMPASAPCGRASTAARRRA